MQNPEGKRKNDKKWLEATITLTCINFMDEGITLEMFTEANFLRIGEVIENLHKQVVEMESKMTPNIPT